MLVSEFYEEAKKLNTGIFSKSVGFKNLFPAYVPSDDSYIVNNFGLLDSILPITSLDVLNECMDSFLRINEYKFKGLKATTELDYNPIENYNREEHESTSRKPNLTTTDTSTNAYGEKTTSEENSSKPNTITTVEETSNFGAENENETNTFGKITENENNNFGEKIIDEAYTYGKKSVSESTNFGATTESKETNLGEETTTENRTSDAAKDVLTNDIGPKKSMVNEDTKPDEQSVTVLKGVVPDDREIFFDTEKNTTTNVINSNRTNNVSTTEEKRTDTTTTDIGARNESVNMNKSAVVNTENININEHTDKKTVEELGRTDDKTTTEEAHIDKKEHTTEEHVDEKTTKKEARTDTKTTSTVESGNVDATRNISEKGYTDTLSRTTNENGEEKAERWLTNKGNIGVTTSQQMIEQERQILDFSLFRYVVDAFFFEFFWYNENRDWNDCIYGGIF